MIKCFKKSLLLSCFLLIILPSISNADINISRITGNDRYDTSLKVSKSSFEQSDYVIVASGENYPDAVFGGGLASQINAPILLVKKNIIPLGVIEEIQRLNPKFILLLGGENTISFEVFYKLQRDSTTKILRLSGEDRIETSNAINSFRDEYANSEQGANIEDGFLGTISRHFFYGVNAYNFYDALYTAPYVSLLGFDGTTNTKLNVYLCATKPTIEDFEYGVVVGDVKIKDYFGYSTIIRGRNRYESSVKIANSFKKFLNNNLDTVILTSGEDYPDGLSSAGLVATKFAPIILTPKNSLDKSAKKFIKENNIENIIIVGGENSVSKDIEEELGEL